ncbi:MAG: hypothetical protein C0490_09970 [Marivirga sp.]|nr:hypothetical protein [Marivirga sp.]
MVASRNFEDEAPVRQDNPTIPELIIAERNGNIETQKIKWISLINEYSQYSFPDYSFVHLFLER